MSGIDNINHFNAFEILLKKWSKDFFSQAGAKVAIARKGPRMVELCKLKNWLPEGNDAEKVISEHALPFILPHLEVPVSIADDAIYFGSTFERIYGIVLAGVGLFGDKVDVREVRGIPAVLSNDAKRFMRIVQRSDEKFIITDNEIPYYINTLISEFRKLGKPYDIEFPLIYFDGPKVADNKIPEDMIYQLAAKLETRSKSGIDEPYRLEYRQSGAEQVCRNWTLLLNKLSPRNPYIVTPEFRKVRFFIRGNKLCIASFAPHIITDGMLGEDSPLFRDTPFAELWRTICRTAEEPKAERINYRLDYKKYLIYTTEDDKIAENEWDKLVREYLSHRRWSLVVVANYLLSYAMLLDIKEELRDVLQEFGFTPVHELFNITDLNYIVGSNLAMEIKNTLTPLFSIKSVKLPLVGMEEIVDYELLPSAYKDIFVYNNRIDFPKAKSVSELISCNFSNQHRFLELASRRDNYNSFERLRFGETFTSLTSKAAAYFSGPSLSRNLHIAMDKRIDTGSIVPKYVRFRGYEDAPWMRLFRSGENEDIYKDQLHRILYLILISLVEEYRSNELPEQMISCSFNLIAGKLSREELFNDLGGIAFKTEFTNGEYCTFFINETGEKRNLMEYCLDYRLLVRTKEKDDRMSVAENEYTEYLKNTCVLDIFTQILLKNYVRVACFICKNISSHGLRELYNWMVDVDYIKIQKDLSRWRENEFLPALDKEWEKIKFTDILNVPFLKGLVDLMSPFPSIDDAEIVITKLRDILEREDVSNLKTLLNNLLLSVERRIERVKNSTFFQETDKRIDIYYALAYLACEKLIVKECIFSERQVTSLRKLLSLSQDDEDSHNQWLKQMERGNTFVEVTDDRTRQEIQYLLTM